MNIFLTGTETKKTQVPFLVNSELRPVSAVNAWIRDVVSNGATSSPCTWRTYAYHLFDFFCYLEDRGIDWQLANNDTLLNYADTQDQNESAHTKQELNRKTINARLLSVGRFYSFAHEHGLIVANPIKYKKIKIRGPRDTDMLAHVGDTRICSVPSVTFERLSRPKIKWCSHEEVMHWLNSIKDWPDKLIAKLIYRLGLRREELVKLKIRELPEISSLNPALNEVAFNITGKGRRKRLVYMAVRDFLEIRDYIAIIRSTRIRDAVMKHDYIFVGKNGYPLPPSAVNRLFARASKRCGTHITPHMLRHSFAVTALQHWKTIGVSQPEKLLQARLGHANLATTQIYIHLTNEMKAEEAIANASLIDLLLKGELL